MAKTVVGTFDTVREAERAAARLQHDGIERGAIAVLDKGSVSTAYEGEWKGKSGGFWSWVFGDVEEDQGRGFSREDNEYYTERVDHGGALVTATVADDRATRVSELLQHEGAQEVRAETDRARPAGPASSTARDVRHREDAGQSEHVIPVVEEQLKVGKRTVAGGTARIYTHTTQKPVEEHIRLRDERIKIERRPVDRPLPGPAEQAFRDQTIEVTETAEEPVIEKQARVVEEVVVGKDVRERDETVRDTVRRGDIEVERSGGARSFATMEPEFRQHYTRTGGQSGLTYEQCAPAYRYGYELAGNQERRGEWTTLEADARRDWEQRNPGSWDRFKDSIRYGWDRARGKA